MIKSWRMRWVEYWKERERIEDFGGKSERK
jgi:hypothetical protein